MSALSLLAAVAAVTLIGYLLHALVRPEDR
jgi:K+-transporting ATPase KdpF subunit